MGRNGWREDDADVWDGPVPAPRCTGLRVLMLRHPQAGEDARTGIWRPAAFVRGWTGLAQSQPGGAAAGRAV